jgi:hypothetical protein
MTAPSPPAGNAMGRKARMTPPAGPGSVDWQRRWTIGAGLVTLQPVTRGIAQAALSGAPLTRGFEEGALHDRDPRVPGLC